MTIYKTIMKDRNEKDADRPLLSLIAGEICVDGKQMDDNAAIKRLSQMAKVCTKNIELYSKACNTSMAYAEVVFRDMIEVYLPKGATEIDIKMAIIAVGAEKSMKSMGKVMGYLKNNFKVVDGNLVKNILLGK